MITMIIMITMITMITMIRTVFVESQRNDREMLLTGVELGVENQQKNYKSCMTCPFLYTEHLNVWFFGRLHTTLLLVKSLKNSKLSNLLNFSKKYQIVPSAAPTTPPIVIPRGTVQKYKSFT